MTSTPAGPVRYRFGEFTVNEATRLLLRGEDEIALIPRYFDLLLMLIRRRPEAVTREEIFEHVWKDVIVSDGALTQAVRTLRKSLGDPARDPRFIRTVSRHGYRFVYEDVLEEPARPFTEKDGTRGRVLYVAQQKGGPSLWDGRYLMAWSAPAGFDGVIVDRDLQVLDQGQLVASSSPVRVWPRLLNTDPSSSVVISPEPSASNRRKA